MSSIADEEHWKVITGTGITFVVDEVQKDCIARLVAAGELVECVDIFGSEAIFSPERVTMYKRTPEAAKAEAQYYFDVDEQNKQWINEFKANLPWSPE